MAEVFHLLDNKLVEEEVSLVCEFVLEHLD